MLLPAMRPPLSLTVTFSRQEAIARLAAGLDALECGCVGGSSSEHVSLHVCEAERRLFSPTLDLEVRDSTAGGAELSGHFGPHPHVWTLYMALYAVLFILSVCGGVYGLSQWMLGLAPTAWLAIPLAVVLSALLYASAFVGQRMAAHQMAVLESFLQQHLELSSLERATEPLAAPGAPRG